MSIFKQKHRILHYIKKKNEYSIHSPYMFDIYNKLIKKNKNNPSKLLNIFEKELGIGNIIKISCSYIEFQKIQDIISGNIVIYIEEPYKDKNSYEEFKKILNDPRTIVSIDLFNISLISRNTKLSHQHYIF